MSTLFIGSAICNISARGKICLPGPFNVAIQSRRSDHRLYIALHQSAPCLTVFDDEAAAEQHDRLQAGRDSSGCEPDGHEDLLRRTFGYAAVTRMDNLGRVPIARWLQERPGSRARALAVGKGDHFELWNLNFLLDRGPDMLAILARLHLRLLGEKDDHHASALSYVEPRACGEPDREPRLRIQSLPAVPMRPALVAGLL